MVDDIQDLLNKIIAWNLVSRFWNLVSRSLLLSQKIPF